LVPFNTRGQIDVPVKSKFFSRNKETGRKNALFSILKSFFEIFARY